jgi:D-alanyl-D-alanine carboxypeptidase (penicillin-binding protein 5/6)
MSKLSLKISAVALALATSFSAIADTAAKQPTAQPQPTMPMPAPAPVPAVPSIVPPEPVLNAKGYVLMDAQSGNIIAQKNMNQRMQPASLTKMMTLYIISENLAAGRIALNELIPISHKANAVGGSRMFVKQGTKVPVQDLMRGIIVDSGNDACTAMAQYIGGNEATFAQMMNSTAQQLGMSNTHFVDSTGLPRAEHYSTPHDMALLARALILNFPQYYHFYNEKWFTYNNIRQPNRNRLLWRGKQFDGVKTGHTAEAGYCLVASGTENGNRLVSVVMGTPTDMARADDSQALLNYGFRNFHTYKLYNAMQTVSTARTWYGMNKTVPLGLNKPLYVTIPTGTYKQLKATMSIKPNIQAPVAKGERLGQVNVTLNGKAISNPSLIALDDVNRGGLWVSMRDHLSQWF